MYPNLRETCILDIPNGCASKEQLEAADRLDEAAAQKRRDAEESFQRCDTDGFLSQWASGLGASERNLQAAILRNGGTSVFRGLYYKGQRLKAKQISFQDRYSYGWVTKWLCDTDDPLTLEATQGRKWLPTRSYGSKSNVQNKLGVYEANERDWAWVKIKGQDKVSCAACIIRVGDHEGADSIYVGRTHADLEKRSFDSWNEATEIAKTDESGRSTQEIEDEIYAAIRAEYDLREKEEQNV